MCKADITVEVAGRLVAAHFPHWSDLPIRPVTHDGWDNTTFRLGDELTLRLPSDDGYVTQIAKEQRWLPVLAPLLPRHIPEPVAAGTPDETFPRPWSIYRWIDGDIANDRNVDDLDAFAADLAGFLTALQAVDATDGPAAGAHSFFRGSPIDVYDDDARRAIGALADHIDTEAVTAGWEAAIASRWQRPPVWVHGDLAPSNLLVGNDGWLHAVLDFGCAAVGDPACDLAIAWTFFEGTSREVFRSAVPVDDATWDRGRGWALWKALITMAEEVQGGTSAAAAQSRCGWRLAPRQTIAAVLADID